LPGRHRPGRPQPELRARSGTWRHHLDHAEPQPGTSRNRVRKTAKW
jgi:hypothetical protein